MSTNVSPGVYSKIIDLTTYLQEIPGTIGFIPFLSKRGPDNKLTYMTGLSEFAQLYGRPNINDFGKQYGLGPYVAWNHMSIAPSLYALRVLPPDAKYSNIVVSLRIPVADCTTSGGEFVSATTYDNADVYAKYYKDDITDELMVTTSALKNSSVADPITGDITHWVLPLFCIYPIGRGDSYNDFAIKIQPNANIEHVDVFNLQIWETQNTGVDAVVESFDFSLFKDAVDDSGDSIFIEDVLARYSKQMRLQHNDDNIALFNTALDITQRRSKFIVAEENQQGQLTLPIHLGNGGDGSIVYIDPATGKKTIRAMGGDDSWGGDIDIVSCFRTNNTATIVTSTPHKVVDNQKIAVTGINIPGFNANNVTAHVLTEKALTYTNAGSNVGNAVVTNRSRTSNIATLAFASNHGFYAGDTINVTGVGAGYDDADVVITSVPSLNTITYGNPGATEATTAASGLVNYLVTGICQVKKTVYGCTQLLSDAYKGSIDEKVKDLDEIYMPLVYDAGYPDDVKNAAVELQQDYRNDGVVILDLGDNLEYSKASDKRTELSYNTYHAAMYEPYTKVFDSHTGRDMWVSPVYHMATMIPLNDKLFEIWYPSAGFNRGTLTGIKDMRYNSNLTVRDSFYLKQINPIVKFSLGPTVWGNLTSQMRPSVLQDLSVIRMILYIKRSLEQFCKWYIFEFNDIQTWNDIKNNINPFLDRIKLRRGLESFSVEVGATEYEKKAKICHVNVILQPTRIIERIELNLFVK